MDESTARRLVLVRAFDQAQSPLWTPEDASWATRLAGETAQADAPAARFLAERARHALERLLPRDRSAARWLAASGWRWSWLFVALALGAVIGLAADVLGRHAMVDVLAPPAWGVIAWNLVVYALLLVGALRPAGHAGLIRRALAGWWRRGVGQGPLREATLQWAALSAPQTLSRAAALLHLAAAAVGAGLVAGLYLRGLVFDYRAGWQSTFLDAETVQRTLQLLLTPAVAWTGIAVPDIAGMEALRLTPEAPKAVASAAPWIHLYAAMLGLFVVVPRALLAALSLLRAGWQAARVAVPLDDPYAQDLLRQRRGGVKRVQICPYVAPPAAQTALALRQQLAAEFGDAVQVQLDPPVRMGDEALVAARAADAAPSGLRIALVELGATPEAEHHGRFIAALQQAAPGVPLRLVADEADFVRRFGSMPGRVAERRAAWTQFAQAAGVEFMALDLGPAAA